MNAEGFVPLQGKPYSVISNYVLIGNMYYWDAIEVNKDGVLIDLIVNNEIDRTHSLHYIAENFIGVSEDEVPLLVQSLIDEGPGEMHTPIIINESIGHHDFCCGICATINETLATEYQESPPSIAMNFIYRGHRRTVKACSRSQTMDENKISLCKQIFMGNLAIDDYEDKKHLHPSGGEEA